MLDLPLEIRIGTAGTAGAGGAGARSITSAGEAVALTVPHLIVHLSTEEMKGPADTGKHEYGNDLRDTE